jgi:uncharacterized protein YndB with AHSA1/START domain
MKMGIAVLACVLAPGWLAAEVVDSSVGGFTVKSTVTVQSAPHAVYSAFFHIGDWWSSDHTFSHDAHNLSLEAKAGGCMCEKLPNGGGVRFMEIVNLAPETAIVLHGALGPLQSMAAVGTMAIQLSPADGGTKIEVMYTVAGYSARGLNTLAAPVDGVLKDQFTRLKNFVEHGDPAK